MPKKFDHILQFKITLRDISPPIWRTIQVPYDYTFWDLHVAIQDAMGWLDYHLHTFEVTEPLTRKKVDIGIPDEDEIMDIEIIPGWEVPVALIFTLLNRKGEYTYDYGDNWQHRILLEKIAPREKEVTYPICVAGRRACPPEDCGGPWGYQDLLKVLADPKHPDHGELMEWVGGRFDPEQFDKNTVKFDDPRERFMLAFMGE